MAVEESIGVLVDDLFIRVDAVNNTESLGLIRDSFSFLERKLKAIAMNTENQAVFTYEEWPFKYMATLSDGRMVAAGDEGLFLLGGDTDNGKEINASVTYGVTDLGGYAKDDSPIDDEFIKRVNSVWFGYRSTGDIKVKVTALGSPYDEQTYSLASTDGKLTNGRVRPGAGLVARYWRFKLENTSGCRFHIVSSHVEFTPSNRSE